MLLHGLKHSIPWGWGDSSVSQVTAIQAWELELDPQILCKTRAGPHKSVIQVLWVQRQGPCLWTGQPVWTIEELQAQWCALSNKIRWRCDRGIGFCTCVYTHTSLYIHTHIIHTHKQTYTYTIPSLHGFWDVVQNLLSPQGGTNNKQTSWVR